MPPSRPPPWTTELWQRMRGLFLLKLIGTSAFTWVFFLGYFHLLRHPRQAPTVMPLTALDALIPFQPATLAFYLSLWLYVGVGPGLQRGFRALALYAGWVSALCLTGLACFYLWPTAVPPLQVDVTGLAGFALLKGVDAAGNACPSLHVAVAIFTAIRVEQLLRSIGAPAALRAINLAWFLAIAWSTLAVKQHVVLDAVAGALLGAGFAAASLHWRARRADIIGRPTENAAS